MHGPSVNMARAIAVRIMWSTVLPSSSCEVRERVLNDHCGPRASYAEGVLLEGLCINTPLDHFSDIRNVMFMWVVQDLLEKFNHPTKITQARKVSLLNYGARSEVFKRIGNVSLISCVEVEDLQDRRPCLYVIFIPVGLESPTHCCDWIW